MQPVTLAGSGYVSAGAFSSRECPGTEGGCWGLRGRAWGLGGGGGWAAAPPGRGPELRGAADPRLGGLPAPEGNCPGALGIVYIYLILFL